MKTTTQDINIAKQMMSNAVLNPGNGEHPCADTYKVCVAIARKNASCVELRDGYTAYMGKTGEFRMDGHGFVFVAAAW